MDIFKFFTRIASFAIFVFFTSCSFSEVISESDDYKIYLPDWPPEFCAGINLPDENQSLPVETNSSADFSAPHQNSNPQNENPYPPLSRWIIKIWTENEFKQFYTNERSLSLLLDKNKPAAILAYPVTFITDENGTRENLFFKPAGKILPFNISSASANSVTLQWEEGFLAEIFVEAAQSNFPVENFNWNKAQKSIIKKSESSNQNFYNPWFCNKSKILENMMQGNFKETYLNASGCVSLIPGEDFFKDLNQNEIIILSSYIPLNQFITDLNKVTVLKNQKELFLISDKNQNLQNIGVIIDCKSKKNISADIVYLPIFNDVL